MISKSPDVHVKRMCILLTLSVGTLEHPSLCAGVTGFQFVSAQQLRSGGFLAPAD